MRKFRNHHILRFPEIFLQYRRNIIEIKIFEREIRVKLIENLIKNLTQKIK